MTRSVDVGSGLRFPFGLTNGTVDTVDGEQKIAQSLRLLLQTQHGERLMRPTYGANLRSLTFRSLDDATCREAERLCRDAVASWEPRVNVVSIVATAQHSEQDGAALRIELRCRTNDSAHELVVTELARMEGGT